MSITEKATQERWHRYFDLLARYTACDIADALLKLQVPNAGFLPDLTLITTTPNTNTTNSARPTPIITVAPASTVIFGPLYLSSSDDLIVDYPEANIPAGDHWADLTPPRTILVISQPKGQKCAVLGGILALRVKILDAKGIVVLGRVRDELELESTGLPIWAQGTSIVASAAESRPLATQVTLNIDGTIVAPGDLVFCDSVNGVVIIPYQKLHEVVNLLPSLTKADEHVKKDIANGIPVAEAFARHRGEM